MASEQAALPADLDAHRSYLYRYAMLQLRDPDRADDAVQETLLAARMGLRECLELHWFGGQQSRQGQ